MNESFGRRCSACEKDQGLSLVIIRYSPEGKAGRILLYCETCRGNGPQNLVVGIPAELVTEEVLLTSIGTAGPKVTQSKQSRSCSARLSRPPLPVHKELCRQEAGSILTRTSTIPLKVSSRQFKAWHRGQRESSP
jgi:hypothetical protein